MNNKINEFIESLLPDDINQTKKESLKFELESHILDAIEFYEENGFSYEKSVEKALSDFCNDEKTKNTIKNTFANLYGENSIASIIKKLILIYIPVNVTLHLFANYMIHIGTLVNAIIIPLIFYFVFSAIENRKNIKKSVRSTIALVIGLILVAHGFIALLSFTDIIHITSNETQVNFKDNAIDYTWEPDWFDENYNPEDYDYLSKTFIPTDIKNYVTIDIYAYEEDTAFHEASATTYIFKYENKPIFEKERNRLINLYSYFEDSITLSGFKLNYFAPPSTITHNNKTYSLNWEKPLYIIGFNEKTNQILLTIHYGEFFDYTSLDTPVYKEVIVDGELCKMPFYETADKASIDETFYKDYCGLKYVMFFNFFLK